MNRHVKNIHGPTKTETSEADTNSSTDENDTDSDDDSDEALETSSDKEDQMEE